MKNAQLYMYIRGPRSAKGAMLDRRMHVVMFAARKLALRRSYVVSVDVIELVGCSVLQCAAMWCSMLQCVAVCCSVLQYVAACRSVLQRVAACCSMLQGANSFC